MESKRQRTLLQDTFLRKYECAAKKLTQLYFTLRYAAVEACLRWSFKGAGDACTMFGKLGPVFSGELPFAVEFSDFGQKKQWGTVSRKKQVPSSALINGEPEECGAIQCAIINDDRYSVRHVRGFNVFDPAQKARVDNRFPYDVYSQTVSGREIKILVAHLCGPWELSSVFSGYRYIPGRNVRHVFVPDEYGKSFTVLFELMS